MTGKSGQVRIIGGQWRSRVLRFPAIEGLRPTPDRVRETLFNWLSPKIVGAFCLDLFAGSGALGFEALSRGADFVVMAEQSAAIIASLQANAKLLNTTEKIACFHGRFPQLKMPAQPRKFDIVFLDPPFHQNWIAQCCQWLEQQQCLTCDALIYIEAESSLQTLPTPANWRVLRSQKAGQVGYHLLAVSDGTVFPSPRFVRAGVHSGG